MYTRKILRENQHDSQRSMPYMVRSSKPIRLGDTQIFSMCNIREWDIHIIPFSHPPLNRSAMRRSRRRRFSSASGRDQAGRGRQTTAENARKYLGPGKQRRPSELILTLPSGDELALLLTLLRSSSTSPARYLHNTANGIDSGNKLRLPHASQAEVSSRGRDPRWRERTTVP